MRVWKLTEIGNSIGCTLPKDELEEAGVIDENGELLTSHVRIIEQGDGWSIEPLR